MLVCVGGPKLRKWYGAPDQLPRDGGDSRRGEDKKGGPNMSSEHSTGFCFMLVIICDA